MCARLTPPLSTLPLVLTWSETSPDPCSAPPVLTLRGLAVPVEWMRRVQVDGRIRWMQVESVDPFGDDPPRCGQGKGQDVESM